MRIKILVIILIFLLINNFIFSQHTVSTSKVWYASLLKQYFASGINFLRTNHPLNSLPCLPKDITKFDISCRKIDIGFGPAFQIKGKLKLGKIMKPFGIKSLKKKKQYMLILKAWLFSPKKQIIWQQKGYAVGSSWVSINGETVDFKLINSFDSSIMGNTLIIIAIGEPIFSDYDETRVILGVKKVNL